MSEAWVPLACPSCGESWQENPGDLPAPGEQFACDHCGETHPVAEFAATRRGFEILESFHG